MPLIERNKQTVNSFSSVEVGKEENMKQWEKQQECCELSGIWKTTQVKALTT